MHTFDLQSLQLTELNGLEQYNTVGGYSLSYHIAHAVGGTIGQVMGGGLKALSNLAMDMLGGD